MSDRFRIKVIHELVQEINYLSGGTFEQFAYKVIPLVQPGNWIERGTTIDGAPRKATVDTSLAAAAYVGEMSSAAKYFDDGLLKLKDDLNHAFDVHPQVKHIILLSSRTAEAGQTTTIENTKSFFLKNHASVKTVRILDARQIAGHIFDHIGKHDLIQSLSPFLPSLRRLADEHAFSHNIPPINGFTPRLTVEANILAALKSSSYVVLQGMSGIGKTALAARIAHLQKDDFDNVIWHDARELESIEQLSNVTVTRSNVSHNISSLLLHGHLLLVLDDPAFPLSQLADIEYGSSKVVVTTQVAAHWDHVVTIHDLDSQESETVLTSKVCTVCPPELIASVLKAVRGHPLVLRALNLLASEQGWNAVADCLSTDSVRRLEDDRNQTIFRRILQRHTDSMSLELQFVKWCGSPRFRIELANAASSLTVGKLDKRGFLTATTPGYARVHDVVYRAIMAETNVSDENRDRFRQRLAAMIRAESDSNSLLLELMARARSELFSRLLSEHRDPAFVYMVALDRTEARSIALLGNPVTDAHVLNTTNSLVDMSLEIRAVVEAVEALYTLRSEYSPRNEASTKLKSDIVALSTLLGHRGLSDEQRTMLEHHRAKMLVRLKRQTEAKKIFCSLLAKNPSASAAATRIQLARILPKEEAIAQCEIILAQYSTQRDAISLNVILETLRLQTVHGVDMNAHEDLLMSSLEHAISVDRSLAIRLIATVAQRAWFTSPRVVLRMFNVDWRGWAPAPNERFDWAQANKHAAKAVQNDDALRDQFLSEAVRAYQQARLTKPFERIQFAEALILQCRYQESAEQLDAVQTDKREAFWWQRKAQALAGLNDHKEALTAIEQAISTLEAPSYLPAFLADRFRIRSASGDATAVDDLTAAIDKLPVSDRFREQLEGERTLYHKERN